MSKNILVVHGSPRKKGNTMVLTKKAMEAIEEQNGTCEEIFLQGLDIKPCMGCDSCRKENRQYCIIKDDMKELYPKIASCDGMLLASPIYWFTITAQLKLFIDRLYGLHIEKDNVLLNKRIGIILTYGDVDPYTSGAINAIRTLEDCFKYSKSKIEGIVYGRTREASDTEKDEELLEKAYELGKLLM